MGARQSQAESSENFGRRRMVDVSDELLTEAARRYTGAMSAVPTHRETMTKSVAEFLPTVVALLQLAGLTARPSGRRRPRNVDVACWEALVAAEGKVALSAVELMRCCLSTAARK